MPEHIPLFRVFLSSPGDVNAERKIARDVIDYFPNRPAYREKVAFRVVAWDKPGAGTPMRATLTPQDAINKDLLTPSECDIVIVIFWSRMGTPFTDTDGREYQSGTHWELLNALGSKRAETVICRRTDDPPFKISDPDFDQKHAQYKAVKAFFESDLFYDADGRIRRGINMYKTPDDFRRAFEIDLEVLVLDILRRIEGGSPSAGPVPAGDDDNISTIRAVDWPPDRSPFPGLRAFTEADAPIFFGRGRETDALVQQLENSRFVAVVGASGSGKSSLVGAGLIPPLKANAIEGSADWLYARFTPGTGNNPFEALVTALMDAVPALAVSDPFGRDEKIEERARRLHDKPERLAGIIDHALKDSDPHVQLLLFIDQFEELFTLADAEHAAPFAAMLAGAADCARLRVIVTMRHDFYQSAVEIADLAELLRTGSFPLAAPRRDALRQMIERPAERAGLQLAAGLVECILDDTGDKPGNLALMAYALDELYKLSGDGHITHADYAALGGVQGAIGKRAEQTFQKLPLDDKETLLGRVFRELVEVDERGTATRQRAPQGRFGEQELALVQAFTTARLLVIDETEVEVAHEALFRSWTRLKDWIATAQEDLILLRQVRNAAHDWQTKHRPDFLLWPQERLKLVYAMQARLNPDLNEVEKDFIEPEQHRLLREIAVIATDHKRRRWIGERLATIGDTRSGIGVFVPPRPEGEGHGVRAVPQIDWLPVTPGGEIEIEKRHFTVKPFCVAKFLTTYSQFQAFLDAPDGFEDERWWQGFPKKYIKQAMSTAVAQYDNYPRDSVSWYQAVAFTRWLDAKYRELGLFEQFEALTPNPSPTGEGLKNYREMASQVMVGIARDLRQRQTTAEELLWECLRDRRLNNLKFRRQHPAANTTFVVDFFCHECKLAIELDGSIHADQQQADQWRQQALEDIGLTVVRFTNDAVLNDLERVLINIQQAAEFSLSQRSVGERGSGGEGYQIRLPTEQEWQWMAQNGTEARQYPWSEWDEQPRANTTEAGIGDRSTAVGMYPHGRAECGALDVTRNLWEWCLNDYNKSEIIDGYSNGEGKVLRGGSFDYIQYGAAASYRNLNVPFSRNFNYGFRGVVSAPISAL